MKLITVYLFNLKLELFTSNKMIKLKDCIHLGKQEIWAKAPYLYKYQLPRP